MSKPRLLDLFCGAGGCSTGYHRAGFEVIGIDLDWQENYPFEFYCMDALHALRFPDNAPWPYKLEDFAVIHASPPCQAYSAATKDKSKHPDLIGPVRELLYCPACDGGGDWGGWGKEPCTECLGERFLRPYVIENVPGAPLNNPVQLCGSAFGLPLQKHRLFESNIPLWGMKCAHGQMEAKYDVYEHGRWYESPFVKVYGSGGGKANKHWAEAMGIDWMTHAEMAQAIPPAYTEHIGRQVLAALQLKAA